MPPDEGAMSFCGGFMRKTKVIIIFGTKPEDIPRQDRGFVKAGLADR